MNADWFIDWFNSPYYDILYRHRTEDEARQFLSTLLSFLQPERGARMLDLACGNGRYSRYLAENGYDVTGVDISDSKIEEAMKSEHENLSFFRHDMRKVFRFNYYDYVFNFFTSFGYFETDKEHLDTISAARLGLKSGGYFLIDYLNTPKVLRNLVDEEEREVEGVRFKISRYEDKGFIVKKIRLLHRNRELEFSERVRAFGLDDFSSMMNQCRFEVVQVFGDYDLKTYDPQLSDRMIILAIGR